MALAEPACRVVLQESSGAEPLSDEARFGLLTALLEQGFPVAKEGLETLPSALDGTPVVALGQFTEAAPEGPGGVRRLDVRGAPTDSTMATMMRLRSEMHAAESGKWKPWFPVIDHDRCTNCMQCLSFCLFGVYGVDDEKRIQVQNQDNCKTNCPACSRVCPEAAIMFPKYKAGPINGDVVSDGDLNREKMKIDISALLGGDVYAMLRNRSERAQSRFSKERDSDKALAERQKCLTKLSSMVSDIPPEVLMSLPSPEEIARRAEEAAAKAKAALQPGPNA